MAQCTKCGCDNPAGANFCQQCGSPLARQCRRCGHALAPAARFCSACGEPCGDVASAAPGATGMPGMPGSAVSPVSYTPPHLAERIRSEQAALEARGEPAGERKTITVLFADMAGSTALIHDLDPEDAHRLITPVIDLMMEAVHYYEGYVAKSLGDGILALFGAPIAHEDHPQRALYAALRMQKAMQRHSDRLRLEQGISLQIRVGIHTGEVVVRSIRKDDLHTDYDPVGHTIHIASRMETMAALSSIFVSESTQRLAEGYFAFKPLGVAQVKGIPMPLAVYELTGIGPLRTRLQVAAHRGLACFVGRDRELETLQQALQRSAAGHGQIVAVVGEAGVGKSRLFHEFKARSPGSCLKLETFSVSHGKAFAYLPLIELVKNYFQIETHDDERKAREKVAGRVVMLDRGLEDVLPYLLHLLGISEPGSALPNMDPLIRRQRTFEAITSLLARESRNQPLVLLFEDLQWLDSETEAFLDVLVDRLADARILLLLNYRPEYQHGWSHMDCYTPLRLDPLGLAEAGQLLTALLGDDPALADLKRLILAKTEGNPFFMEEVVQTLCEEKALLGEPGHYRIEKTPTALHIPTTVQGVLAARIDRLSRAEKDLLQTLAVIGKEFSLSLIQRVVAQPDEQLRPLLAQLEAGEFIYERPAFPDTEYTFKHALTQEVAGNSLLTEQRTALHQRTAQAIEALFQNQLKDHYGELARHYSLSGNDPKAVEYLQYTGQQAVQRSAYHEAISHLNAALELLARQPDTPERAHQELALRLAIGPALTAARGFAAAEVETTYSRALALCGQGGDTPQLFPTLVGLRTYFSLRAEHAKAYRLGKQLLRLAGHTNDPELSGEAHVALGMTAYYLGRFGIARTHLGDALALYGAGPHLTHLNVHGVDPEVRALSMSALVLWALGYPDQGIQCAQDGLALARQLSHPFSLAHALCQAAELHQFRREPELTQEYADATITLSTEQGFPLWRAWTTILRGWALAEQGQQQAGIALMHEGLDAYHATGAVLGNSHFQCLLAHAYGRQGQWQAGLDALAVAKSAVDQTGEHYCEAEWHRLNGVLARQRSAAGERPEGEAEAEACFHKAIEVARHQHARSLELRAALDLAQLWRQQGKEQAAIQLLAGIRNGLTEGFDSTDLQAMSAYR
ncbi:adenylate/guanylate cyclase domain-containing protein [Cupriavidus consociatus]|uniref:adenylate/guanylate cyclase domain-containing protein n=1 Tax=Cupriavidus consociatus TaxID=2821357 RepID=UPI001AE99BDE|nr:MULTISPECIES: adenylate/guanylate cyclase domain-containing protein [unclassified Cupriavidus]MBP0619482.1 AAA family ATPase [Cupriavidus sp. LEh25]MDK2656130.1 adenylate/guanylate cyclase domain-containing protein [Cupriavidus sp. LEh21]